SDRNCEKLMGFSFWPLLPVRTTCQSRKAESTITSQKMTVLTVEFTQNSSEKRLCKPERYPGPGRSSAIRCRLRELGLANSLRSPFYSFRVQKSCASSRDLSHGYDL